ncbi:TolC family protein [Roseimicrobium sp. ORNL1]|uniref:TolC family protein n=1 Tax=Roseimicrobium sp. ORNL1 TaxID=2711231 RepID=UPI0013E1ED06|nr:TolC family protein [Roseimicrobium sp. ORNL1]QIF03821.1 TolC family protein [Roseimicrobium sp. ORNL1]
MATNRPQAGAFSWPSGLSAGSTLSVDQAVGVSLWNNPDFQSALADLGISKAEVIRAGQLPNPTLSLLLPNNPQAAELAANLPLEMLWLRPKRVRAAKLDAEAVAQRLMQGGIDLARDVKLACAAVELAREKHQRAKESANIFGEIAKVAESRFKAGDTGELEVSQSRAEALVVEQDALRLQYEERLAMEKLRALLGLAGSDDSFALARLPSPRMSAPASAKRLTADAMEARPDVKAAQLTAQAAAEKAKLAPAEMFALGIGSKTTEGQGTQGSFDVALPILNQNQAGRAAANAQLNKAVRQLNAARERVAAEVRQARIQVEAARSVAAGWTRVLPELETSLTRSRRLVELGDTPQLVTLDAARRLADARSKAAESDARLREAWAELERATGNTRLPKP